MFFRQIIEAFLVRTDPDSSMVKPAHIHITNAPQIRKEKVLKTNAVSSPTPVACATDGRARKRMIVATPVAARMAGRRRCERTCVMAFTSTSSYACAHRASAFSGEAISSIRV